MTTLNSSQLPLPFQDMHPATTKILRKVFFLHIPMLLSLYVLTDDDTYYTDDNTQRHHLAVFTALQRHPPSARVFRCLLEFVLLGFCTSFSICVWERVVGKEMLGRLMFDTPYTLIKDEEEQTSEFEMVSSLLESRECGDIDDTPSEDAIITSGSSDQSSSGEPDNEDNGKICSPFKQRLPPQPPSAAAICNASLDILLLILVFLFLFIISSSAGGQYIDQTNQIFLLAKVGEIAAPVFPLLLFFLCFIQLLFPWTETKMQLWTTVSYTIGAPMFKVTFRDGFIGDVFTSVVRPLQDLAFTSFYVASGLRGWWTYREETTEEHIINPVEQSWLLHTVILPACMISPLWWRYSQTLRQTFDHKKRWPYLGNAAKYFFAAQVAVIGVYDPQMKSNVIWLAGFVFATLYQIWWDVFMDWELFYLEKNSFVLEWRTQRLYQSKALYIFITVINIVLRFGWTLNFIPNRYLSEKGILVETFSQANFSTFINPFLATVEILRRTLWGLLRLELEAIKVQNKQNKYGRKDLNSLEKIPLTPMTISNSSDSDDLMQSMSLSTSIITPPTIFELCLYATLFSGLGFVAMAHRGIY